MVGFVYGSSSSEASRRGSDVNKQMDLVFYLFLTGVREVAEPSDTSTTSEKTIDKLDWLGQHLNLPAVLSVVM